jgi:hypothetical protein
LPRLTGERPSSLLGCTPTGRGPRRQTTRPAGMPRASPD